MTKWGPKRNKGDYKVKTYTLSTRLLEHFEGVVGQGLRSGFVEDAILEKLERTERSDLEAMNREAGQIMKESFRV